MKLQMEHLTMTYPTGKKALQDMSLTLSSPQMIGLLGPNGAGKSTLMKLLTAALLPTQGSIFVDARPLAKSEGALKAQLGYLPQDFGLYEELTVTQFLDYMAALKGIRAPKAEIRRVLSDTNLTPQRRARIRTLSGGQRQRVGIAQALLGSPQLLILDEPTVGLDPEERIHFRNLFAQEAKDKLVLPTLLRMCSLCVTVSLSFMGESSCLTDALSSWLPGPRDTWGCSKAIRPKEFPAR